LCQIYIYEKSDFLLISVRILAKFLSETGSCITFVYGHLAAHVLVRHHHVVCACWSVAVSTISCHSSRSYYGCTGFFFKSGWSQTWPDLETQIQPEPGPDLAETCFGSQNNTPVIKLMVSTMLSAATESVHYSSVLPLLCYCLPVFNKICKMAMNFVFLIHTCIPRIPVL